MNTGLIEAGSATFFTGVKMLGAITVAFFILLGAFLYFAFVSEAKMQATHATIMDDLTRMEAKLDNSINVSTADRNLSAYFLRQICINGANSDLQKQSCNPPPSILQRQ